MKQFLAMDANSGRNRRVVYARNLKQAQRRYPRCLVQPLPPAEVPPMAGISPGPVVVDPAQTFKKSMHGGVHTQASQ